MKAGYVRLSEDPDETFLGIERQIEDITSLHHRRFPGEPIQWYVENDTGASDYSKAKSRDEYDRLIKDIRAGVIDGLLGYDQDRIWRKPSELEEFFNLVAESDFKVCTVDGEIDMTHEDGQYIARIKVAGAAREVAKLRRRVKRKHTQLAQAGLPNGGRRCFGFEDDRMTHREDEAAIIRAMVRTILDGGSVLGIATALRSEGVPGTQGGSWYTSTVQRIITAPRIAGLRSHKGVIVGPAAWDPIVTPEDFYRVQAILDSRKKNQQPPRRYPLSRMLVCHKCGRGMVGMRHPRVGRRYMCSKNVGGCDGCGIVAEKTELLLRELILSILAGDVSAVPALAGAELGFPSTADCAPEELDAALLADEGDGLDVHSASSDVSQTTSVTELLVALEGDERAIRELEDDFRLHRTIDRAGYLRVHSELTTRIEDTRARLARAQTTPAISTRYLNASDRLLADWPDLTVEQQALIYRTFIRRVVVGPAVTGKNFDPSRLAVELAWNVGPHAEPG